MMVETAQMMPITRLQKELTQTVRKVSEKNESVYILKNNNMEAVIVPFREYEYLSELEEAFERLEIAENLAPRMKRYNAAKSVSWDSIRKD